MEKLIPKGKNNQNFSVRVLKSLWKNYMCVFRKKGVLFHNLRVFSLTTKSMVVERNAHVIYMCYK